MKTAKIISLIGVIAMTAVIGYAFAAGDFATEGSKLIAMSWGVVSLVDLYTGFTLFSLWIFFREKSTLAAVVWTVAMMTLGFFAGALYVFINLQTSHGDWKLFFLGKRA
ncbi:MAG: hypothetical protein Fur002_02590 [Anaerolineales bacterium]